MKKGKNGGCSKNSPDYKKYSLHLFISPLFSYRCNPFLIGVIGGSFSPALEKTAPVLYSTAMSSTGTRPIRALLVQLPLLDPGLRSARANVPLAAGYLAAAARRETSGEAVVDILPEPLASGGGDAAILSFIERDNYDVVCFTAYLWNLERSLDLAKRVKAARPTLTVMGGPEIVPGRRLLDNDAVDAFVCGEGETVFPGLLRFAARGEKLPRVTEAHQQRALPSVPNPYVAGVLPVADGTTLHLETMRGCARRCSYCFYAKSRPALRYFPEEPVGDFFALAAKSRAAEVYVMDPSFEMRPRLDAFLRRLAEWNPNRIPLHTELCLESVTPERAELLARAGFVSVEAGLQSTNPRALAAVRRRWDRARFLRGAESLKRHGIEIRTGVILGLPEDTIDDFAATLDFLLDHGLDEAAEIYPLAVLPGSELAERAKAMGLEAMSLPPYWALGHESFSFDDFFRAEELVREKLGKSLFERPLPHFTPLAERFLTFVELDTESDLDRFLGTPETIGNSLTLLVGDRFFTDDRLMARLAGGLRGQNPHTLLQIAVRTERDIGDGEALRASDRFFAPGAFAERCHAFDDDTQGRFAVRLFALVGDCALARSMEDRGSFIDPVLEYRPGLLASSAGRLATDRPLLLIPDGIPAAELCEAEKIYADTPESLLRYGTARRKRT